MNFNARVSVIVKKIQHGTLEFSWYEPCTMRKKVFTVVQCKSFSNDKFTSVILQIIGSESKKFSYKKSVVTR